MDLDTLLQGHRDAITVRRIYGDPVERDRRGDVEAGDRRHAAGRDCRSRVCGGSSPD
jgi:hypothetical protein